MKFFILFDYYYYFLSKNSGISYVGLSVRNDKARKG